MDVYSRKIANDNSNDKNNTRNSFSSYATRSPPSSRTQSLHLATSDGCFIPEEIKQQILKARHDCMLAKQRMLLTDQASSSSTSTSPNNSNTNSLRRDGVNSNSNELGTFINVSYRNSRHNLVIEQKGSIHSYAPHLSLIHISEPTRRTPISYAVFCL